MWSTDNEQIHGISIIPNPLMSAIDSYRFIDFLAMYSHAGSSQMRGELTSPPHFEVAPAPPILTRLMYQ